MSGDGTTTIPHYYRNSTRLYQFDLSMMLGKVLDALILPSTNDYEEGAWVVLTEKAGIWAIPEKSVILGGVEPPERSLSHKGSSNERSAQVSPKGQKPLTPSTCHHHKHDDETSAGGPWWHCSKTPPTSALSL